MTAILKTFLDDFFEEKATGQKKIGEGIPPRKFSASQERGIRRVLKKLWGKMVDDVTYERVIAALKLKDLPPGFGDEIESTISKWIQDEFIPAYRRSITFAAEGDKLLNGMMTHINDIVGGDLKFNPTAKRLDQIIQKDALDLAVNLEKTQKAALKNTLSEALQNNWGPKRTYEMLQKNMTLTDQESQNLLSFEKKREAFWKKHFEVEHPDMKPAQAKRAVRRNVNIDVKRRYRKDIATREDRFIRTELTRAREIGNMESMNQAIDGGLIKKGFKEWDKTNAVDNWQSSIMYDGKRIGINESYWEKFGKPEKTTMLTGYYPGEINELCKQLLYAII